MYTFGEIVTRRRKALDLTQKTLALKVGCSLSAIRKIESGVRRPSRQIAELLFQALDYPLPDQERFVKFARGVGRFPFDESLSSSSFIPLSQTNFHPTSLPVPISSIVGRTSELASLHKMLADPNCRLITLLAPGGMGKTRLALEVINTEQNNFNGQVYFIPLASLNSTEALLPTIATAVGISFATTLELQTRLYDFLRQKRILLVLDNFDSLIDAAPILTKLLQNARQLKILVTTRERLRLQGEWIIELKGLDSPPPDVNASVETYSALDLFVQRARQVRSDLHLTPSEIKSAVNVCNRVGGMPLAIELAAAWMETLSCAEVAYEIERGLDFLASSMRDTPEHQSSLRAVFEQSWLRLSPQEQQVLSRLTIFQSGFSLNAALDIAEATPLLMASLVSKSMIYRKIDERFDLHEVIRRYASEYLSDIEQLEKRFSVFYLNLLETKHTNLFGAGDVMAARQLSVEADNLWLAWEIGLKRADFLGLDYALESMWILCDVHGWLTQGINHFSVLINTLRRLPVDPIQQIQLGRSLAYFGMLSFRSGDYFHANFALEESITILRDECAHQFLPPALIFCGIVASLMGEFDRASTLVDEGVQLCEEHKNLWFLALGKFNQGFIFGQMNNLEQAYQQMQAGLSIWRELINTRFIAFALNFLSPIAIQLGILDEARIYLQESSTYTSQLNDHWGMGTAYGRLGLLELECGNLDDARNLLEKSLTLFNDLGARWDIAWAMTGLGRVFAATQDLHQAKTYLQNAIILAVEAQALPQALEASIELAACWLSDIETHHNPLHLLAAASIHPAMTNTIRRRLEEVLSPFQMPSATESWETLVRTIMRD